MVVPPDDGPQIGPKHVEVVEIYRVDFSLQISPHTCDVYGKVQIYLEFRKVLSVLVYDINLTNNEWRVDTRMNSYFNLTVTIEIGEVRNEWIYTSTVRLCLYGVNRDIHTFHNHLLFLVTYSL